MEIDDETLMALADGEITGDDATRLRARIAEYPDLAARYALFTQTAHLAKTAAMADPDAGVSAEFEARIRNLANAEGSGNVVPFERPARQWQRMAIAASLALAVGLSAGLALAPGAPPSVAGLSADLRDRLDRLPAGAGDSLPDGVRISIVASFTDGAGAFCREYETVAPDAAAFVNIACLQDDAWNLRFAMAMATSANDEGYVPAASLSTLDAFYAATGASQPLALDEEQQFLK